MRFTPLLALILVAVALSWPGPTTVQADAPNLDGLTVGIVTNGKQGTVPFFDGMEERFRELGAADVERLTKPSYSAPAPGEVMDRAARWQVLGVGSAKDRLKQAFFVVVDSPDPAPRIESMLRRNRQVNDGRGSAVFLFASRRELVLGLGAVAAGDRSELR